MIAQFMSFYKPGVTANQAQTKLEEQGPLKLTTLCPAGKLLQTKKDLISKPRPSHSSLVVALLSQVVALWTDPYGEWPTKY